MAVINSFMLEGNRLLRATIDDNNELYVIDRHPFNEDRFHTRFYVVLDQLDMVNNDSLIIYQATNRADEVVARIELRRSAGEFQVRVQAVNDEGAWFSTAWGTLVPETNAIEIYWQAASAPGADDGECTVWVNDIQLGSVIDIDNDTRRVDNAYWGVIEGIDSTTRGVVFYDLYESRRDRHVGMDGSAPSPLHKIDPIFINDFENGFSSWFEPVTDNGDLSVAAEAAITSAYGMKAVLNDNNNIYVTDLTPYDETTYRARFYLNTNYLAMADGDVFYPLYAYTRDDVPFLRIAWRFSAGEYQVRLETANDNGNWVGSSWNLIANGLHAIELEWVAAPSPEVHDGYANLWVDNVWSYPTVTDLDNDMLRVDYVRLGAVDGIDDGTRGTFYIDAFKSLRWSSIGLQYGAPSPTPLPNKTDDLFADQFESGDFSTWDVAATDNGDLTVTSQAAIVGSYGMQAVLDDNNSLHVTDWSPWDETHYRARCISIPAVS